MGGNGRIGGGGGKGKGGGGGKGKGGGGARGRGGGGKGKGGGGHTLLLGWRVDKHHLPAEHLERQREDPIDSLLCTQLTMVEEDSTQTSQHGLDVFTMATRLRSSLICPSLFTSRRHMDPDTGRNNGFTYIYQQCQILCKSVPSHLLVHLHMVQTCKMFDYSFNSHLLPL